MRIAIIWDSGRLEASLNHTPTAQKLWAALPCSGRANIWGDEVYFSLPFQAQLEPDARQVVDKGTVCFWVEGSSLALPYGPTPISVGDECRLVSDVNVLGMIEGDPSELSSVEAGEVVRVERAD